MGDGSGLDEYDVRKISQLLGIVTGLYLFIYCASLCSRGVAVSGASIEEPLRANEGDSENEQGTV